MNQMQRRTQQPQCADAPLPVLTDYMWPTTLTCGLPTESHHSMMIRKCALIMMVIPNVDVIACVKIETCCHSNYSPDLFSHKETNCSLQHKTRTMCVVCFIRVFLPSLINSNRLNSWCRKAWSTRWLFKGARSFTSNFITYISYTYKYIL